MSSGLIASIDLGTNTARLLIGHCADGKIERCHISRKITRLGGGFCRQKGLSSEAEQRTITALQDFAADLQRFNVSRLKAVATSAVRDAANRDSFCRQVKERTGIDLEVISGEQEGRLTLKGVLSGLDVIPETLVVFDVGGGSTEYTIANGDKILFSSSLPLGVVRLTEGKGTVAAMGDKIERELDTLLEAVDSAGLVSRLAEATLVATAGTATTLAAIDLGLDDYDYRKVNNHIMSKAAIDSIFTRLLPLTNVQKLAIAGMEPGREDLIIAGSLLTMKSMEKMGIEMVKVSDFGLLEGVLFALSESCG
jgi:exopolyphosphatase/guanosine-5'-triphosphate,3'-diphosphate pyrophosphatase